ncbi:uncharacterized protein EI90DRAFT_2542894 [Cantharellus anzutake]|uniref:uncharacterized protein n=1 Tax=Cantharellus anzutake TaxID=1750568 RepID=UPI0019057D54|nr:uncharacterized protein EI90DRAFT_2542894 [Cantharellus anzutake]KAF8338117.1 hypothetical protein EI90DRAFT_2542894 [Cantharellus anzutake]
MTLVFLTLMDPLRFLSPFVRLFAFSNAARFFIGLWGELRSSHSDWSPRLSCSHWLASLFLTFCFWPRKSRPAMPSLTSSLVALTLTLSSLASLRRHLCTQQPRITPISSATDFDLLTSFRCMVFQRWNIVPCPCLTFPLERDCVAMPILHFNPGVHLNDDLDRTKIEKAVPTTQDQVVQ